MNYESIGNKVVVWPCHLNIVRRPDADVFDRDHVDKVRDRSSFPKRSIREA